MLLEKKGLGERYGKVVGFVFSVLLFATVLFGILYFLDKLPSNWSYLHVLGITLLIIVVGCLIKRWLK